jgi:PhoH-like ATPase
LKQNIDLFVLDTSSIINDPNILFTFSDSIVCIPFIVLQELDGIKSRFDKAGYSARKISNILDDLRSQGNVLDGIEIGKQSILRIIPDCREPMHACLRSDLNDDIIINTALSFKDDYNNVTVVSNDINIKLKCNTLSINSKGNKDFNIYKKNSFYLGHNSLTVDEDIINDVYKYGFIDGDSIDNVTEPYENQYYVLTANVKQSALVKYTKQRFVLLRDQINVWGIHPRNKEQRFCIDALLDDNIQLVSLIGAAGTGKTLLAIAAGIHQVLQNKKYDRLIVTRPIQTFGKDIGFLPGSIEEKMAPWIAPIHDNLDVLFPNENSKNMLDMYISNGLIKVEAMPYIRGRSIPNSYIIVDEAQNLNVNELKTIITRAGQGTKIILTGDVQQVDRKFLDPSVDGIICAVEKFKNNHIFAHITLTKSERSELAALAINVL